MEMTLMGLRPVKFQNKEGELIEGTTLYTAFEDEKGGVIGRTCEKFFANVDVELPTDLESGDKVEITFDYKAINEQISNFAQSYPANSITASIEAPLLINRYRFVSCSCFSCFCKKA